MQALHCPQCGRIHPVNPWYQHKQEREPIIMPRVAGAPKMTLTSRMVGDVIFNRAKKMADSNEEELDNNHLRKATEAVANVLKSADLMKQATERARWKLENAADTEEEAE